jgi:hypothetical protein
VSLEEERREGKWAVLSSHLLRLVDTFSSTYASSKPLSAVEGARTENLRRLFFFSVGGRRLFGSRCSAVLLRVQSAPGASSIPLGSARPTASSGTSIDQSLHQVEAVPVRLQVYVLRLSANETSEDLPSVAVELDRRRPEESVVGSDAGNADGLRSSFEGNDLVAARGKPSALESGRREADARMNPPREVLVYERFEPVPQERFPHLVELGEDDGKELFGTEGREGGALSAVEEVDELVNGGRRAGVACVDAATWE